MAGFCSVAQVLPALPGLVEGSSLDVSTTAIQEAIDETAAEIREGAADQGFSLSALTNHQTDLLAGLNEFPVEAALILRRSTDIGPQLLRYAQTQKKIGAWMLELWRTGQLQESWLYGSPGLPRVELCTITQACSHVADFQPTAAAANPRSYPANENITDWIRWRSALVYSIAATVYPNRVPSDISTLSADVKATYRSIVSKWVGSQIVRVQKAQKSTAAIDPEADELLLDAQRRLIELQSGKYDQIFLA